MYIVYYLFLALSNCNSTCMSPLIPVIEDSVVHFTNTIEKLEYVFIFRARLARSSWCRSVCPLSWHPAVPAWDSYRFPLVRNKITENDTSFMLAQVNADWTDKRPDSNMTKIAVHCCCRQKRNPISVEPSYLIAKWIFNFLSPSLWNVWNYRNIYRF